jgi:general secretion pathway protein K
MRSHAADRRGVALILVLWMIVILGGVAAAVTASSRSTSDVTANARARTIARYAAESGVVAAVSQVQRRMDAAGDDVTVRRAALNDVERVLGDAAAFELGDASIRVVMVDVSARLDVNAAPEEALAALFARTGASRAPFVAISIPFQVRPISFSHWMRSPRCPPLVRS